MTNWQRVLIAGFVGAVLLGFVVEHTTGEEMTVDVSQVNGLPQKLQALQDQINAILATLPKTYATAAALAGVQQQLKAIQLTPGPKGDPGPPGPAGLNCLDDPNCKAYVDAADAMLNLRILNTATTLTARLNDQTVVVEDAAGLVVGPIVGWTAKAEPIASVTAQNGWVFNAIATTDGLSTVGLPFVIANTDIARDLIPLEEQAQVFFEDRECRGRAYIVVAKSTTDSSAAVGDVTPFSIGAWTPTKVYLTTPGGSPSVDGRSLSLSLRSGWSTSGKCLDRLGFTAEFLPKALFKEVIGVSPTTYSLPFVVK